jgi:hypothetical protein
MKQEIVVTLGQIMGNRVGILLKEHTDAIMKRLDEEFEENEGGRTQLTVPIKVLIVREGDEFQIESSLDLVKRIKETYSVDPVNFNPNQPDLFNGSDPVIPEAGNQPPEAEDPIDKMEVGPDNKDLEEGQQEEEDTEPNEQPVDTAPTPEEASTTDNDEQVGGEDVEKVDNKVVEEVVNENTLPEDSERCEVTHPKCKELRCILPKGHTEGHKLDICGEKHKDGVRVCIKPKGHDGQHKYADLTM